MDMFSIYGIYAALEAMEMSGLDKENESRPVWRHHRIWDRWSSNNRKPSYSST